MTRHRVTVQFDLDITDEDAARDLAAGVMRGLVRETEGQGGQVFTSGGQSPEVATHGMAQSDKVLASLVTHQVLARGVATMPWAVISAVEVGNELI